MSGPDERYEERREFVHQAMDDYNEAYRPDVRSPANNRPERKEEEVER